MKKFIFTESQIKKVLDVLIFEEKPNNEKKHMFDKEHKTKISEQSIKPISKFPFAFDNSSTDFQGQIKNGFLYLTLESPYKGNTTFKVGPLSKTPRKNMGILTVTKKNGKETVTLAGEPLMFAQEIKVIPVKN
jgi:hypothetical protein